MPRTRWSPASRQRPASRCSSRTPPSCSSRSTTSFGRAANAGRALRPERVRYSQPHLRHKRGFLLFEPLGVVGVISQMAGLLYGEGLSRKLGSAWRHRRGLLALGRRYLSGL